jgi:hypothetical protein
LFNLCNKSFQCKCSGAVGCPVSKFLWYTAPQRQGWRQQRIVRVDKLVKPLCINVDKKVYNFGSGRGVEE